MYFSIIVPLFNKEKHILRAINSLLKQTYVNFEIIVVDDGSTDNSYKIVSEIDDSRIKIFKKNNEGVSSARNFGIAHASNKYVGFLDADDAWKPTFLESIKDLIAMYAEAGVYATSYEYRGNQKSRRANINVAIEEGKSGIVDYFQGALKDPLISASSVVIEKKIFDDIGLFSVELNRGEDLEMWYRIALKYDVAFLNKPLSIYYQDSENKLTNSERVYSKSFMSQIEDILIMQKNNPIKSLYFEEYMISRLMSKVRYLILKGDRKKARQLLWKYKNTKNNKKQWIIYYIFSFKPVHGLYDLVKQNDRSKLTKNKKVLE